MGGADLQDVPWPVVIAVVVIAAAFVSSMRGIRRQRRRRRRGRDSRTDAAARLPSTPVAEEFAVIEDLPSGRMPPDD